MNRIVDVVAVAVLCLLALAGFDSTFGGTAYLVAGGAGIALGLALAFAGAYWRVPAVPVAAAVVVGYFVVGLIVPGPRSIAGLLRLPVHGWKQLLTTLPPIGGSGPLLGLPFLLGLAAAALGAGLALRTRPAFAPLLGPLALLIAIVLLGPAHTLGWPVTAGFAAVSLAWVALRHQRNRPLVQHGARQTTRLLLGIGMLAVAFLAASALGSGLPGSGAKRVVLRNYVHPPFEIQDYPSPLSGFRLYTKNGPLNDTLLFSVSGLPAGVPVQIAALPSYDGVVWGAGDPALSTASEASFQRVGTSIAAADSGPSATVSVTIADGYSTIWLPTVGEPTKVRFSGPNAKAQSSSFRFDLATSTGVVPAGLAAGDRYSLRAVVPPSIDLSQASPTGAATVPSDYLAFVQSAINSWSHGVTGPLGQLQAAAKHLHDVGRYSDGNGDESIYLPGHSVGRLTAFLSARQLVGDDEQYAAVFALMANQLGFPARVVLGALPEADGGVKGKDVHAWVQLQTATGAWATVPTDTFTPSSDKKPDKLPPQQQQDSPASVVPPPNAVHPPGSLQTPDQPGSSVDKHNQTKKDGPVAGSGFHLPRFVVLAGLYGGPPLGAIILVLLGIVLLKALRRRRRRSRGAAASRVAAGWRELVDHARDLGAAVPGGQTRHEDAQALPAFALQPMAGAADRVVFGPGVPDAASADRYWSDVDEARQAMSGRVGRWRRLRAAVSLRSLRRPPPALP